MEMQAIFGLQALLSFIGYGLIAAWYLAPRLRQLPLRDALIPLLFLHAFRHLGMVFLVPAVVAPTLSPAFARPAAWGDLLVAILALLAIVALRMAWPAGVLLAWIVNVVGTLDLLIAVSQGVRHSVAPDLGAAWLIPTFVVPGLLVTHVLMFQLLARHLR